MTFDEVPHKGEFKFNENYDMSQHKYNDCAIKHPWIKLTKDGCVSMIDITGYIKYVPPKTEVFLLGG